MAKRQGLCFSLASTALCGLSQSSVSTHHFSYPCLRWKKEEAGLEVWLKL
jgi:hypothetical protein